MGNRNQKGRFTEKASLEDVLAVFNAIEGPPVVTSADVAEQTGISRESARQKLERLRERDDVDRRETAGQVVLYWTVDADGARPEQPLFADPGPENDIAPSGISDAGERSKPADGESMAPEEEGSPGAHPGGDAPRTGLQDAGPAETPSTRTGDAIPIEISELDLAGSGETLRRRREAVGACYLYLRERGTAQKRDFTTDVYPDHEAGYGSAGGWWNTIGKDGLAVIGEQRDEVLPPGGEGEHTWTFVDGAEVSR